MTNATNGKLLIRIDERVQRHTEQIEKLVEKVDDIKIILTEGEGKIKRNYMLITDHTKDEAKRVRNAIALTGIVVAGISVLFNIVLNWR